MDSDQNGLQEAEAEEALGHGEAGESCLETEVRSFLAGGQRLAN